MSRCLATLFAAAALALALAACGTKAGPDQKTMVFASVPPIGYLAERIAGGHAVVRVLIAGAQDPHTFEPSPSQVLALSRARLYLNSHLPFETRLLGKISGQTTRLNVVDLLEGVDRLPVDDAQGHDHDHSCGDEHFDVHAWLGPAQLRVLAQNICRALTAEDPAHADDYRAHLESFLAELESLRMSIAGRLAPYAGRRFFVYHPAFGYFAAAFHLEQVAVETGGKSPTPKRVRSLIHQAIAEHVNVVFVQPQYAAHAASALAECIAGRVVPVDPLAADVLENLRRIAGHLEEAFLLQDKSRMTNEPAA